MIKEEIIIYTDGACSGNPGKGGYAAILIYKGIIKKISGSEKFTTNNRMELTAAIVALKEIKIPLPIIVYTDSKYLEQGITNWIKKWHLNDFKKVKNLDLWLELNELNNRLTIDWCWVKAHSGIKYNEMVDNLAKEALKKC